MSDTELFDRWKEYVRDEELLSDLEAASQSPDEIHDRFYRSLEFGTAGLRGILGAGTNRMNVYTVRQATQGLSEYLLAEYESPSVAIAYDTRHNSELFAREAASTLAANGIGVWIYGSPAPTPMLSYAVRERGCSAGIVVTASHNPKNYNGYKAYSSDGCQISPAEAAKITERILATDVLTGALTCSFDEAVASGKIRILPDTFWRRYYARVIKEGVDREHHYLNEVKAVYTPLNGTGAVPVTTTLSLASLSDVEMLEAQKNPDSEFTTCPFPNPELPEAMSLAIARAKETGADVVIGTDPDCDRLGLAARERDGSYRLFSGNEVGAIFFDFICRARKENGIMPENPVAVRSIVSTRLFDDIAAANGVETRKVFTGFRFIGKEITKLEEKGEENRFIFGFEESCGYMSGTYVRDKDGVNASLLAMEAANYWKLRGRTLGEAMEDIQKEFGYWCDRTSSYYFTGESGALKIKGMMDTLRSDPPSKVGGVSVSGVRDYAPESNMIEFTLSNGCTFVVRPSGTEPKIKTYCFAKGSCRDEAESMLESLVASVMELLGVEN